MRGAALFLTAVMLAACSTAPAPAAAPATVGSGGTVTLRVTNLPTSYDPSYNGPIGPSSAVWLLYDSLVYWGPDGKLIPGLASSWTATPDAVTFKIRDDVTCSDGTKMTPTAVANSISRMMKSPRGTGILGTAPFKVTADDAAGTVTWSQSIKNAYAVNQFTSVYAPISCPAGDAASFDWQNKTAGSGMYLLESTASDRVTFKIRPEYTWGPNGTTSKTPGVPEKIVMRLVENETTAANLLLAGELDLAAVGGPDGRRLDADKSITKYATPTYSGAALALNQGAGLPFENIEVRRAFVTAIDRQGWCQAAYDGQCEVTSSWFSKRAQCYEPATEAMIPPPSIEKARQILIDAGWSPGPDGKLQKGGKPLEIRVNGSPGENAAPEYVAAQLTKVGITAILRVTDFQQWANNFVSANYDITLQQGQETVPLPLRFLPTMTGKWRTDGGANTMRTKSPEADREYDLALQTTGDESCNHFKAMQRVLIGTYQIAPMAVRTQIVFARGLTLPWKVYGDVGGHAGNLLRLKS